ncbi:hypothetical protein D3C74_368410 [compost metagenome]
MLERGLRDPEQRIEVGLEHAVEVVRGDVRDRRPARHLEARVVDEHVQTAQAGDRVGDRVARHLLLAQVPGQQDDLAARLTHPARGLLGVLLLLGQVADRDVGALPREGDRDGPADARVAARDQGAQARETARTAVGGLPVVGSRVHRCGEPRGLLLLGGEGGGVVGHGVPPSGSRGTRRTGPASR